MHWQNPMPGLASRNTQGAIVASPELVFYCVIQRTTTMVGWMGALRCAASLGR
ncbi:hypothetical protein [Shewanella sp. SR43-8]|uniref:hypothetical protein n=1 Tax=Shewanella sp. SR43-8 TaxID=2760938 RepID=UPI0016044A0E|nr:hypothetical protein [Shewanella sp. SR43-8]MBB1320593.1 hypothetical protein [Shewanella sp. SR43-8]